MAATRCGDDRAFEQLYQRYQRRIGAYVHGMVKDHGRAEDITQEVFMAALRRMRETERPIIFKPWVYEIAKNACIDAFRRSRRAEEVSYDADESLGAGDHLKLVSSSPTPDAAVDTRMTLDNLRGAFGGLSDAHHDILVMRELEGLSYREIGERLGMSRPSVESTLFRARRRLTEEYEELATGKRCQQFQGMIADAGELRLGARDERKMARHVSHCQPCRRAAYGAGIDVAALAAGRGLRSKIAALLPLPAFLKRRWLGGPDDGGPGASLTHWSSMAGQYAEPIGGWAKAAAVAATVAVAGAGAGVATTQGDSKTPASGPAAAPAASDARRPAAVAPTAAADRTGAGRTTKTTSSAREKGSSRVDRPSARRGTTPAGSGSGATPSAGSGSGGASTPQGARGVADGASSAVGGAVRKTVPKVAGGATGAVDGVTKSAGEAVQGTTGAVTDTVNKTTGTATGAVRETTKTTTDTVNKATGALTGTIDKTTNGATSGVSGTVDRTAGAATGAVDRTAGAATGTIDKTVGTATGAVDRTAGAATGTVEQTTGAATGAVGGLLGGK